MQISQRRGTDSRCGAHVLLTVQVWTPADPESVAGLDAPTFPVCGAKEHGAVP